jgi:sugar transferase EpsL
MTTRWWRSGDRRLLVKRTIDVVGSAIALILFSPAILASAAAIRLTMGKPVLFVQQRPGYQGEPFMLCKFRTMRAPREGEEWNRTDDIRMTRVGRFLRLSSLDELPTLFNVLKGDMSLVGPRPLVMEYLEKYTPEQNRRHDVAPGVTGWAQVNGRESVPFSRRLVMDVWYVDHWGVLLDIKILFRTVGVLFLGSGVDKDGDGLDAVDDLGLADDRDRFRVTQKDPDT